jgi:hypothetical protein
MTGVNGFSRPAEFSGAINSSLSKLDFSIFVLSINFFLGACQSFFLDFSNRDPYPLPFLGREALFMPGRLPMVDSKPPGFIFEP